METAVETYSKYNEADLTIVHCSLKEEASKEVEAIIAKMFPSYFVLKFDIWSPSEKKQFRKLNESENWPVNFTIEKVRNKLSKLLEKFYEEPKTLSQIWLSEPIYLELVKPYGQGAYDDYGIDIFQIGNRVTFPKYLRLRLIELLEQFNLVFPEEIFQNKIGKVEKAMRPKAN